MPCPYQGNQGYQGIQEQWTLSRITIMNSGMVRFDTDF